MEPVRATLSVTTGDPAQLTTVVEQMARTAAGLALDGVTAFVAVYPDDDTDSTRPPLGEPDEQATDPWSLEHAEPRGTVDPEA